MNTTGYNSLKSWGIAVACSFVNLMVLTPSKVFGIFFVEFLDRYNTDRQSASVFIIVSGVLRCFAGPLTGYLGEIFELRCITAAGCFAAALGVGICFFAEDILIVNISLGFIYGVGIALSCNLLPQILKQHFTENIAIAVGVTYIGGSIGGFVTIPAITMLLNTYGVSGTLLILSGIMLHGVPVAMLLWNPKYKRINVPKANDDIPLKETLLQRKPSIIDSAEIEILLSSCKKMAIQDKELDDCKAEDRYVVPNICITDENQMNHTVNNCTIIKFQPLNQQGILVSSCQLSTNKTNIEAYERHNKRSCCCIKADKAHNKSCSCCIKPESIVNMEKQNKYRRALKAFIVFKDQSFLVIMLCQSAYMYVVALVYTTLIEVSRDKGFPQSNEQFLLMFETLAETIGFTCLGWTTDKGYVSVAHFMAIGFVCMAISCYALVIANSFHIFVIATMGFGISFCGISTVNPSLIYAFIDEKMQSMAISSRMALYVPFSFTLGPLIGYFRGTLGSYDGALYLSTAICLGCAVLLMLLPCISSFTNRKCNNRNT